MNETELQERFDEMLDDVHEPIKIGFGTFYPSQILKELDPIAYRIGLSEFEDYLEEEDI